MIEKTGVVTHVISSSRNESGDLGVVKEKKVVDDCYKLLETRLDTLKLNLLSHCYCNNKS